MKKYLYLILFFVLICSVTAIDSSTLKQRISEASVDVESFFNSVEKEDIVIVRGSKISIEDKVLFNLIKSNIPYVHGITIIKGDQYVSDNRNIVLIGSEKTNRISKNISSILENRLEKDYSPLILETANIGDKKILMMYSEKEKINLENTGIKKSPLNNVMPEEYVPAAATLLSMIMLYLWQVFGNTLIELINETVSSKILDKWSKKKKIKKNQFLNLSEIIAFLIFVVMFAFMIAYSWSSERKEFFSLLLLNFVIIGIISFIRELARLIFCHKHKFKSEYVFWPFGTLVTAASTFLGNTFSISACTLLDEDEKDEKKFGRFSFIISLMTFLFGITAYIMNIFAPSVVLQMIFVFSIMIVFIELFPMSPFPGQDIKKWSFPLWVISYVVVFLTYMYMNFTVYV